MTHDRPCHRCAQYKPLRRWRMEPLSYRGNGVMLPGRPLDLCDDCVDDLEVWINAMRTPRLEPPLELRK
jgi:hypothetical protein